MKRKMAFLLAVVLTVSAGFMAYATGLDNGTQAAAATQESTAQPEGEENQDVPGDTQGAPGSEDLQDPAPTEGSSETGGEQEPVTTAEPSKPAEGQEPGLSGQTPGASQEPVTSQAPPEGNQGAVTPQVTPGVEQNPGGQGGSGAGNTENNLPGEGNVPGTGSEAGAPVVSGEIGQIDVTVEAALAETKFTIVLAGPGETQANESRNVTVGSRSSEKGSVTFEGLSDGTYTLTVSAKGFLTYTQNIEVKGKAYGIKLITGYLAGVNYEGTDHPGVLVTGDVNGDGKVNDEDRGELVNAIDGRKASGTVDLNGDGTVDLVDLECFAMACEVYEDSRNKQSTVGEYVPRAAVRPAAGAGTVVEGSLESLLENSGSVTLRPEGDGQTKISDEHPVTLQFDFADAGDSVEADGIIIESGSTTSISDAVIVVEYEDENGQAGTVECPVVTDETGAGVHFLLNNSSVSAERDGNGNIRLHLGSQIAVKRVTLTITGVLNNNNLAEISRVEFVNGMENRIPEPKMDIPQNLEVVPGNKQISLTWDPSVNVTGYEVAVKQGNSPEQTIMVTRNSIDITSYNGDKLKNYQEYQVKVQSVNGTWRSGYGKTETAIPKPDGKPDKPDMVNAEGRYKSVAVSWKNMEDTLSYNLFYKESSASEYQKIENITGNSYLLNDLKDLTSYSVYVTGVNEFGESGPSLTAVATTTDINPAVMPQYKLINTGEAGKKGAHIVSATMSSVMKDSPLDTGAGTAWGTVDHDAVSHYYAGTWDIGGYNALGNNGLIYEFDEAYMMDRFAFHDVTSREGSYFYVKVRYWDENGVKNDISGASISRMTDADNRIYYLVKFPQAVKAKRIQFGIARYLADGGNITVSEVYFYYYDDVFDKIMALYQDDLHTVLKPEVTQETIDALRTRINTPDEVSGEYHPDLEMLERELKTAEDILNASGLGTPVMIHNTITTNDVSRGFGGLNAWQPLGVTAAAQDKIVVYVGHNTKKTGENTNLQLIATQYNSEAGAMSKTVGTLKIGANEITVPKIWTLDYESGGALYVQYTGNNPNDQYAVRVSGGVQVPVLDLYRVEDENERLARTVAYVEKLESYVSELQANHEKYHQGSDNALVNKYTFDAQTCILGASDIMLDTMMFSLPAAQIWAGSGSGGAGIQERAQRILNSMDAMEDMMYLFYQHKGLNSSAADAKNRIPAGHQNIRYQRMFAKAFMYASGNHIGIGWGSASGMVTSSSVDFDENGKWKSGSYFGWGVAHEIGHCINQGAYAVAEITNNYFSVLAQAKDTSDSVRFQYKNVYDKVTSGTKGRASNVFTQLGMYWQLHLAYDSGYNYMTYADYDTQLENLFFARVDTYARDTSKAPAPGGVALTLTGDGDQNLMRLSCAAAKKNNLEFFERWGMTPDEGTRRYAEQFEVETRAIYYVNDDARVYRLENKGSILGTAGVMAVVGDVTATRVEANRIDFVLSSKNIPVDDVLGYEIVRCTISGGKVEKETVGFTTDGTFSDIISTMNNRTVFYEITLIDKYLNRSAVKTLEPIKIEHDGSMDKSFWTVSTRNLTVEGETDDGSSNSLLYCDPENETAYIKEKDKLIDNKTETVYTAKADGTSEITLEFNRQLTVAGFKITAGTGLSGTYEIQVCCDGIWRTAATGTLGREAVQTIHFANEEGKYISTYDATAAKLILNAAGGSVSIAELDVLGVTGDNVDFRRTDGEDGVVVIGKLSEEFKFGDKDGNVIPKGSIVFAGSYKGNAAYNVVILYDQDGNIVGKVSANEVKSDQIILSDVPEEGNILDVKDGIWIYWVSPETDLSGVEKVRAELYRVNKAETNEGQRLVSDSLFENMPKVLPEVSLDSVAAPWK